MDIIFQEERALEVFKSLNSLWVRRAGIFSDIVLPQDRWPLPETPREQANYFLYAALPMRGAVISEDPFRWLSRLREKFPEMFEPEMVAKEWSAKRISEAVRTTTSEILNGGGNGNQGAGALGYKLVQLVEHWRENSIILSNYWGGNLLNVFWGVLDYEEAFRRIDNQRTIVGFKGMRRKIFALLTIWLQEKKLIPTFPTPLPVDFHTLRILWVTEALDFKNVKPPSALAKNYEMLVGKPAVRMSERLINEVTKWSQGFLVEHKISHLNINPAIWVLSRELCAQHLQNSTRENGKLFFDKEVLKEWPKNRKDPCSYCPLKKLCTGAVPSVPYYRRGILVRLERVPNPRQFLPGLDWTNFIPLPPKKKTKK